MKKTLIAVAIAGLLTGCGGSGSKMVPVDNGVNAGGSSDGGSSSGGSSSGGSSSGGSSSGGSTSQTLSGLMFVGVPGTNSEGEKIEHRRFNAKDFDTLIIDGQEISLLPANAKINAQGFYVGINKKGDGKHYISEHYVANDGATHKYQYSRFGAAMFNSGTTYGVNVAMFTQGHATKNMPDGGKAKYQGGAVGGHQGISAQIGKSSIEVDFGEKTVMGNLTWASETKMPNLPVTGTIRGNTFESKTVQGQFYGPNAAEIGGVVSTTIRNDKGQDVFAGAAFGGIKQ